MKTKTTLSAPPVAIMIHVPEAFFEHDGKIQGDREEAFRRWYELMGTEQSFEEDCFYHFISTCPSLALEPHIQFIYVCFKGKVQYKAILVKFMRNEIVDLPTYQYLVPRNWCVTTGPVVKPPHDVLLKDVWKGARQGFRYLTEELF